MDITSGREKCEVLQFLCLSVLCGLSDRPHVSKNHTSKLHKIFGTCYVWPWLGPQLMTVFQFCGCHVFTSLAKYRQAIGKLFTVSRQLALLVVCNIANYLLWLIRWQWGWSLPGIASFQKWNRVHRVEQWSLLTANRKLLMNNDNSRFMALCLGLPGWAGTRRNIHPPTILTIIQYLSASSIY